MMQITPVTRPIHAEVDLPGSKSITNRALLLAALASGTSRLSGVLFSDDTLAFLSGLQALGVNIEVDQQRYTCVVQGVAGQFPYPKAEIYCHEAGTAARFLIPGVAVCPGKYHFSAAPRMQERPIAPLLCALESQGVSFEYEEVFQRMPFLMHSEGLSGGVLNIGLQQSSQFLSGLLMAAPYAHEPVILESAPLEKKPYVHMTIKMMQAFGVDVAVDDHSDHVRLCVPLGQYRAQEYRIEPDASTASYFFAMAAITGGTVLVKGLSQQALQGDVQFLGLLADMGCQVIETDIGITVIGPESLRGLGEIDMSGYTDTFMTLAVCAVFADRPTTIKGLAHTRLQESDRVAAMAEGLQKMGVQVETTEDSITIHPGQPTGAEVKAYNDHRIAMSLSLVSLKVSGVVIDGAACVSKTCPDYFERLQQICV